MSLTCPSKESSWVPALVAAEEAAAVASTAATATTATKDFHALSHVSMD